MEDYRQAQAEADIERLRIKALAALAEYRRLLAAIAEAEEATAQGQP
jgi:hypothetical protein